MKVPHHPPHDWARFIRSIRHFFESRGFLEVSTPLLVPAGAFENAIDPLTVHSQAESTQLHTSPEMEMKVVLAEVKAPIFQICKCFRDDPDTEIHFKEFHMLEFYRPHCTYETTQKDVIELLLTITQAPISTRRMSIDQLFREKVGIELEKAPTAEQLLKKALALGLDSLSSNNTWEDLFFRIMLDKIEPSLDPQVPTLVTDYPASVSTLAKPKDSFWGERFELFWKGMELCNGATELVSEKLLRSRYEFESRERQKVGKAPHPFPERLAAVMHKLPESSGVAVGLDRLFWAVRSQKTS